jgi:hypothetical protein
MLIAKRSTVVSFQMKAMEIEKADTDTATKGTLLLAAKEVVV